VTLVCTKENHELPLTFLYLINNTPGGWCYENGNTKLSICRYSIQIFVLSRLVRLLASLFNQE